MASARPDLATLFTGGALTDAVKMVGNAVRTEADPAFQALGGGADSFRFSRRSVTGSAIAISGTYRAWSKIAQIQPGGKVVPASPGNLIDFSATLARCPDGLWRVSSFTWAFHPGSAP